MLYRVGALTTSIKPLNDHELAIARTVDRLSSQRMLCATSIPDIGAGLGFTMYRSDSEFLVNYIRWRVANPVTSELVG